jgi:DNA-binding transcriptional ArsR family regulator
MYCREVLPDELLEQAARRFALLGDPTRLRILRTLMEGGELSVGEVAVRSRCSRFNASAHLNRLADGALVARRRQGTTVYYRVLDEELPRVCEWVCSGIGRSAAATLSSLATS